MTVPDVVPANDGPRRNAPRKQPAASRARRPKRTPNFRRRRSSACGVA